MARGAQSFGPPQRLRKAGEFSAVFASRQTLRSRRFVLHYRPSPGTPRLGVTVAKKYAGSSVLRNRVKRIVRESFRRLRGQLSCCDMVLRLAVPVTNEDTRTMKAELDALLLRIRP